MDLVLGVDSNKWKWWSKVEAIEGAEVSMERSGGLKFS